MSVYRTDGVQITGSFSGSVNAIEMNDLSKGIFDERLGTHSGAGGDPILIMDIAEPTLVTIEIKGLFSLNRTGRAELGQGDRISALTFSSDGKKTLMSDSLTCPSSQLSCIRDVILKSELIEVTPGQMIRVGVSGSGKIFPQIVSGNESYSGNFTYTVRVIEETGCSGLTLDVFPSFPDTLWPTIPNGPHDDTALVEPKISDPAPSGGCVVDLDVEPVTSQGHPHGVHQRDKAGKIEMGGKAITSCTIPMGELTCKASDGSISPISYTASEISGEEKITATLAETGEKASKSIFAMVPAIEPVASNSNIYELVPSDRHGSENHYGVPDLVSKVISLAMAYQSTVLQQEGVTHKLRIGNMSLPRGGLFDIFGNWNTPHRSHRIGTNVDISRHVLDGDGNLIYFGTLQPLLDRIAKQQLNLTRRLEDSAEECPAFQSGEPPCIHYSLE